MVGFWQYVDMYKGSRDFEPIWAGIKSGQQGAYALQDGFFVLRDEVV